MSRKGRSERRSSSSQVQKPRERSYSSSRGFLAGSHEMSGIAAQVKVKMSRTYLPWDLEYFRSPCSLDLQLGLGGRTTRGPTSCVSSWNRSHTRLSKGRPPAPSRPLFIGSLHSYQNKLNFTLVIVKSFEGNLSSLGLRAHGNVSTCLYEIVQFIKIMQAYVICT